MSVSTQTLIGVMIFVVVAALIFPLINTQVQNLTEDTPGNENYVGDSTAPIVNMIPIFYWLAVALVVIGVAVRAVRAGGGA